MNKVIIKACKIDSIVFASFAIKQNIDFLGIHVIREDDIGEHEELVEYVKKENGKPIIVTKIESREVLFKLIDLYKPVGIQLHYEMKQEVIFQLRRKYPELLLFGVITDESRSIDFNSLSNLHDYVIYDTSYIGGTNESNKYVFYDRFPVELRKKTLLAGRITAERIEELSPLNACGYDIQSYFRNYGGINFRNLDKVFDLTKLPRRRMLSVSLTDLALTEIHKVSTYFENSNLEYHLDYSPGTLYPSFNTTSKSIKEKQQFLSQIPYSIHLFMNDNDKIEKKIERLCKSYPLNLIRIFVQFFEGIDMQIFDKGRFEAKIIPSIFFKDINSFIAKTAGAPIVSLVVPKAEDQTAKNIFFNDVLSHSEYFEHKEIWFDRNLDADYINLIRKQLHKDHNYIIGKEVINDWSRINKINEQLRK